MWLCRWERVGRSDQQPMEGAQTLLSALHLQVQKSQLWYLQHQHYRPRARGAVRALSWGFFHILKELKRSMGCLETADISQERDTGNIQFASRFPDPDNQKRGEKKKEGVIQSRTFVQKQRLCIWHTFPLCYRNLCTVEYKRERNFEIMWCCEENVQLGLRTLLAMWFWARLLTSVRFSHQARQMENTCLPIAKMITSFEYK